MTRCLVSSIGRRRNRRSADAGWVHYSGNRQDRASQGGLLRTGQRRRRGRGDPGLSGRCQHDGTARLDGLSRRRSHSQTGPAVAAVGPIADQTGDRDRVERATVIGVPGLGDAACQDRCRHKFEPRAAKWGRRGFPRRGNRRRRRQEGGEGLDGFQVNVVRAGAPTDPRNRRGTGRWRPPLRALRFATGRHPSPLRGEPHAVAVCGLPLLPHSPACVRDSPQRSARPCWGENLWAHLDLNQGPHPYQGCALTRLSYGPDAKRECTSRLPRAVRRLRNQQHLPRRRSAF